MLEELMPLVYLITGAALASIGALLQQKQQHAQELKLHRLQNKSAHVAEEMASEFLSHEIWVDRSWDNFREKLGGFEDNELRKLLVGLGAVRNYRKDGSEWWSLRDRQQEKKDRREKRKESQTTS